jgi:hypothetical protein
MTDEKKRTVDGNTDEARETLLPLLLGIERLEVHETEIKFLVCLLKIVNFSFFLANLCNFDTNYPIFFRPPITPFRYGRCVVVAIYMPREVHVVS